MEEAHIVLMEENEIVVDPDLLESIAGKLDTLGKPNEADNFTIFPVPYKFRQSKENLFEPSVVSIGPFHRGKTSVQTMEEQKLRFLRDFLSRGDHISLNLCLSEIKKIEERTRRCYSESVPLDSNRFVEMMLLDGCFVLEYFLNWYERRSICHSVFILPDLLLLENQIPFFIVEKLFEIGLKEDDRRDFRNYLVNVFARAGPAVLDDSIFPNPTDDSKIPNPPSELHASIIPNPPSEIPHFVHLCYHCSIPNHQNEPLLIYQSSNGEPYRPSILIKIKYSLLGFFLWVLTRIFLKSNSLNSFSPKYNRKRLMVIPCATELQNAGIKLRPKSNSHHMLHISFDHHVFKIPTLTITDESRTSLANLIAFEQYKLDKNSEMRAILSSYALLLDSLVNTPEDVKILQKCGIVNNCLDSDEELTDFFNQICQGMDVKEFHFLADLFVEVNKCCESSWSKRRARWNRHKKQFIRTYFSSPWTAISLVAAVVIVLLSFLQTFFAIYAYFVPPSGCGLNNHL